MADEDKPPDPSWRYTWICPYCYESTGTKHWPHDRETCARCGKIAEVDYEEFETHDGYDWGFRAERITSDG